MLRYPTYAKFVTHLTTTTIGAVMPQYIEEFGEDKNIDIVFSPSHELFSDGVPGIKPSGIYMDKSGNWKIQANIPL